MKTSTFNLIVLVVAAVAGYLIYAFALPKFLQDGGPLVALLLALIIMLLAFVIERQLSINKAQGKGQTATFLKNVQQAVNAGDIDGALAACDKQRGSMANVIRTGLERYNTLVQSGDVKNAREMNENIQRAIEEATMLEVPMLERNLVSLSTIASIGTMVGLLGTVIGMIRAFQAMAVAGGQPDAIQLSRGISEALVNTAGGLVAGIGGIISYNYFVTKIDNFTYMIDEASYAIVQSLSTRAMSKSK